MTIPMSYQQAREEFDGFLADARDTLDLPTRHSTYTCVEGVLVTFRRRLDADQVLIFAGVLPPLLRALFVAGWHKNERVADFGPREALELEVRTLRKNHNLSPVGSIAKVAGVLRHHLDAAAFERVLVQMPDGSSAFWCGPK